MEENRSPEDSKVPEFDYASFGQKLSDDPKMIELASLFYSPRELVDIFYLCAQHKAGDGQKREEEFDRMLERKAEERFNEAMRKSKGRLRIGQTENYKKWQISGYKLDIATEMLKNRKEVLDKISQKRVEIENEIKRIEGLLEKMDDEPGEPRVAV